MKYLFKSVLGATFVMSLMASCDSAETLVSKGNEALAQGDSVKAAEYFSKAAEKQNAEAMRNLAQLYLKGKGADASAEKAVEMLTSADQLGDSIAPYLLGECYEAGNGVEADDRKAFELYEKSGQAGYPQASVKLTDYYFRGRKNIEPDWGKAYLSSVKASALGDAEGLAVNGLFTGLGIYGPKQDKEAANKMLQQAIDKGSALAKALMAYYIMSCDWDRVSETPALADAAIAAGEPFGYLVKGMGFEHGYPRGSFATAVKYYKEASEKGCIPATYRRGMALIDLMFRKDEGHEWVRKAAAQGDADGLNRLGYSYLNGFGEEKSSEKAFQTFIKAAEKCNPSALSNLGYCYENGEGVKADKQKAIEYYEKAIKYGDTYYSQERLKKLK